MSHKISCSRCKKQIIGMPNKVYGSVLCDDCYPFVKVDGKLTWKEGRSVTFGINKR